MRTLPILLSLFLLGGCDSGPVKGTVTGTVTLDGQPVEDGLIRFVPADGNSQPADCILVKGVYTVTMTVGDKKVEVTWSKSTGNAPADTAVQSTQKSVEMIPAKYNVQTTLLYSVVKGPQQKDFPLTGK